tara:strand:- start:80 stop:313 length:234 start_codon:yes stop_codon:yes gene_type:complete
MYRRRAMSKTKEEMLKLSDDELIAYHNGLVEENEQTDDPAVQESNFKQMELFREIWIEKNGLKEDMVIETRTPRSFY